MYNIRPATIGDVEIIIQHCCSMFFDMGLRAAAVLHDLETFFRPWLQQKMAAGAGLWLMDWPPGLYSSEPRRGNILNVYTNPKHRRQRLARRLVNVAVDWCRQNQIRVVILHASDEGRPLYETLGFRPANEMRLTLQICS